MNHLLNTGDYLMFPILLKEYRAAEQKASSSNSSSSRYSNPFFEIKQFKMDKNQ